MGSAAVLGGMLLLNHLPLKKPALGENRILAELPSRPRTLSELRLYPKGMDAYVVDQFPARAFFIGWINYLRYKLGYSGTGRIVVGRDGWLFYDDGAHLAQARNAHPLTLEERRGWVSTLAARVQELRSRNITYVVMSAPVKELIYPDKAPAWARRGPGDGHRLAEDSSLIGCPNVVAPSDALRKTRAKVPNLYTPFETHWTGPGAYVAYVELVSRLKELGRAIEPLPQEAFSVVEVHSADLTMMLGISSFVRGTFPRYYNGPLEDNLKTTYLTEKTDWTGARIIETGLTDKPSIQLTMDSFSTELMHFLYPHFSRLIVSHHQDGFYREDLIKRYNPDIVVLEVIESGIRYAMSPASQPNKATQKLIQSLLAPH